MSNPIYVYLIRLFNKVKSWMEQRMETKKSIDYYEHLIKLKEKSINVEKKTVRSHLYTV